MLASSFVRVSSGPPHAPDISALRDRVDTTERGIRPLSIRLAADLLQSHDETGISLDDLAHRQALRRALHWLTGSSELRVARPCCPAL